MLRINVVLHEPEIPQNTGNIARICIATGARLHLIKPLGFSVDDRHLKRAGLDYWEKVDITYYDNFGEFLKTHSSKNFYLFTKKATQSYDEIRFSGDVYLVFGKETYGLHEEILDAFKDSILTSDARRASRARLGPIFPPAPRMSRSPSSEAIAAASADAGRDSRSSRSASERGLVALGSGTRTNMPPKYRVRRWPDRRAGPARTSGTARGPSRHGRHA